MTLAEDIRAYIEAVKLGHEAHAEQRYGNYPYTRHLAHVENVLARFSFTDLGLLAAAWLHDSVEDGGVPVELLLDRFGHSVTRLVTAVTDGQGKDRKARKRESYAKMQEFPQAIPLKLADRIANVESSLLERSGLVEMYRGEHEEFRGQLYEASLSEGSGYTQTRVRAMWSYLDALIAGDASAGLGGGAAR